MSCPLKMLKVHKMSSVLGVMMLMIADVIMQQRVSCAAVACFSSRFSDDFWCNKNKIYIKPFLTHFGVVAMKVVVCGCDSHCERGRALPAPAGNEGINSDGSG